VKSRFRQLFESSPDAMVIVDSAGQIRQANPRAETLFGYRPGELLGQDVERLFPGQSVTFHPGAAGPGETAHRLDLVGSRRDVSQFPAEVNVIPIEGREGTMTVMSIKDITEAQRAQFVLELGLDTLESADREQHALLGHLIRAQEEERGRIAADIHDDTIQMLAAANLRLQQLRHRLQDPDELRILGKLQETLTLSLSRLRQLIFDLRPPSLQRGSLDTALHALLEQLRTENGIAYQVDDPATARTPGTATVLIYRIIKEALANVREHASATTVRVQFADVNGGCLIRIVDDGVGYDPAEVENRPGHLGLTLMRERAQVAGGWCRIESTPGDGTTVEFWVPFGGSPEAGRGRAA
jgi:PAS domain S-box-containing protein